MSSEVFATSPAKIGGKQLRDDTFNQLLMDSRPLTLGTERASSEDKEIDTPPSSLSSSF